MGADWERIKEEYIATDISYRGLADKYGVSFNTLKDRAKRELWKRKRDAFVEEVTARSLQEVRDGAPQDIRRGVVEGGADKLLALCGAADKAVELLLKKMGENEEVSVKMVRDIAAALKDLVAVTRNLYGLPTVQEQAALNIAAERLVLDKAKVDGGDESETGVIEITATLPGAGEKGRVKESCQG